MRLSSQDRAALRRAAQAAIDEVERTKHGQDLPAVQEWQRFREEVRRQHGSEISQSVIERAERRKD